MYADILHKFLDNTPIHEVYRTGPAPVMMKQADWRKMIDYYEKVTSDVENDEPSKKKMGWLREMYTFSAAAVRI